MADEPIDLTRERFNRVDAKLDRILDAIESLTLRVGSIEQKTAIVVTDIARLDAHLDDFNKLRDFRSETQAAAAHRGPPRLG